MERILRFRNDVKERIESYFADVDIDLPWARELEPFSAFATRGKLLRGCLLLRSYELHGGTNDVVDAAAAVEIVHSGTLVHDDVMDRDEVRRGLEATHVRLSRRYGARTGESLAICLGDTAFFCSYELLSRLETDQATLRRALSYYSTTLARLGLAQMEDVALAERDELPSREEIEEVLIEKSGRYSFSLPLVLGAILAGEDSDFLEEFGCGLGLIFQIKDDELGLWGTDTGKPSGSDVREGKKTLFWRELVDRGDASGYGRVDLSDEDVQNILDRIESSGAKQAVLERMEAKAVELRAQLDAADVPDDLRTFLSELIEWNLTRTK